MRSRKLRNSTARCRRCSWPMTLPVATSRAANSEGAVPSVVVGLALGLARPHGQQRLAAVEGLDLRLLVDAEHQGAVGGVEVETDDVAHLLDQLRVGGELEMLAAMRLQAEGPPDPLHAGMAEPTRPRHRSGAPVSGVAWRGLQRLHHHRLDLVIADLARRATAWLVDQAGHPSTGEPGPPFAHRGVGDVQFLGDLGIGHAARTAEHDPGAQGQTLRRGAPPGPALERLTVLRGDHERSLRTTSGGMHAGALRVAGRGSCILSVISGTGH